MMSRLKKIKFNKLVAKNYMQRKILVLAANPTDTTRLRLDKEVRDIQEGIRRSKNRDQFEIEQRWAVRPVDLRRALLDEMPQIIHFCGHGAGEAGILLEDEMGQIKLVSTAALSDLFALFSQLQCIVLNACYSEPQADAIAQHVNYVIGMSDKISDSATLEFSLAFYDALGSGLSCEDAFLFGRNAIHLAGSEEHELPVLRGSRQPQDFLSPPKGHNQNPTNLKPASTIPMPNPMPMPPKGLKPRMIQEYHVFLASPGDVDRERQEVRRFFDEYNRHTASVHNLRFVVIDWENYATTGVGRPQELITSQTLERYQDSLALVIGLMAQRFGQPTGTHESGTEEEFAWALQNHLQYGFPEIKWFFRKIEQFSSASSDPLQIQRALEQWTKVQAFKERLQKGLPGQPQLFYREFIDTAHFKDLLRQDLSLWLAAPKRPWSWH